MQVKGVVPTVVYYRESSATQNSKEDNVSDKVPHQHNVIMESVHSMTLQKEVMVFTVNTVTASHPPPFLSGQTFGSNNTGLRLTLNH